jgi:DNA mismatch repair protein MutS2
MQTNESTADERVELADAFVDATTAVVLGVRPFVEQLGADSRAGRARAVQPTHFGPGDVDAWRAELERLLEAEQWCEREPSAEEHVREALAELPVLDRPLRKLAVDEVLGEAELFTVKRFLYYGAQAAEAALDVLSGWAVPESTPEQAYALMEAVHPQAKPTPRFHLTSELSEDLEELRITLRQHKKSERTRRHQLAAAIEEDYGGTFDLHGTFRPPEDACDDALRADPRLERTRIGWELTDDELCGIVEERERIEGVIEELEYELRAELSERLRDQIGWLDGLAETLTTLDVRLAKVRLKRQIGGCWPDLRQEPGLLIQAGREPGVVRALGPQKADQLQPIDVEVGGAPAVITGPNMGGKSVLLRLIGLSQWCAQHAFPAPAARCEFAPVSALVYVGSEEPNAADTSEGLSSFGREVSRLVDWWERGEAPRLWLFDELGRGTHPEEGAEIARQTIAQLVERGDGVVAATHFPAVAGLDGAQKLRIAGLTDPDRLQELLGQDDVDVEQALREVMDYQPVDAGANDEVPRDARVVAKALGLAID